MKHVVITGVSTGIGYAIAADLVSRGYHVYGSVRMASDGDRLRADLGDSFTCLRFDVTEAAEVAAAANSVASSVGATGLAALINNAGIIRPGPLMYLPLADLRDQLDINVTGVLCVTQAFLPLLGARKGCPFPPGRIINMSSVSGRTVYPFMAAYAASKHALEAVSDGLRRELTMYGIDVIVIQPGTVRTPLMDKFVDHLARFKDGDYGYLLGSLDGALAERRKSAMPVQRVVDTVRVALESPRPKARYALPRKRFIGWLLPRLPDRWLDALIARQLRGN
jgi:NAD(P)-dependent dehydrogenase (short-subunit alcohol dehydrogenase family)